MSRVEDVLLLLVAVRVVVVVVHLERVLDVGILGRDLKCCAKRSLLLRFSCGPTVSALNRARTFSMSPDEYWKSLLLLLKMTAHLAVAQHAQLHRLLHEAVLAPERHLSVALVRDALDADLLATHWGEGKEEKGREGEEGEEGA